MAFPWPAKKDAREPGAKPEFPSAFDDLPEALPAQSENPLKSDKPVKSASRDSSARMAGKDADSLPALTERLETLSRLVDEAKEQMFSYLLHRESQSGGGDDPARALARGLDQKLDALYGKIDQLASSGPRAGTSPSSGGESTGGGISEAALKASFRPVAEKIEQIDAKLKSVDGIKEALVTALTKLRDGQAEQHNAQAASIRQLGETMSPYFNAMAQYLPAIQQQVVAAQQHADAGLRAIIDILRPPQAETTSAGPAVGGDWQEALLGGELAHNPALNADRNRLLGGVLSGDPGACGLVGSLLQFRAAAADKMPPLLKDIGEAFYRWQPKAGNKPSEIEKALVEWLMRSCDQAGMANTIEVVSPGERFDSLRHNAARPGVEVTQVLGWIVLRDNGKVYTKASVAVK